MADLGALHLFYDGPVPPAERAAAIKAAIEGVQVPPEHARWRRLWRESWLRRQALMAKLRAGDARYQSIWEALREEGSWRGRCIARYLATKPRASLAQAAE